MSHVDTNIFSSVIYVIDAEYGKITKMIITRGKIHKCLSMTIEYYLPRKLIFYMVDYIGKILDYIPEYMRWKPATPPAHQPFDITEDATKLS